MSTDLADARLMRIRPATGVAVMSGGALTLAAIAAQAQAAEMARDIKAIGQRVDQLYKHLQDDQIGAVEHAVEQVEDLVGLLRAHGKDGVSESDVSVVRNALGDASRKCMQHLKTAVKNLENANQGSTRQAEQILRLGGFFSGWTLGSYSYRRVPHGPLVWLPCLSAVSRASAAAITRERKGSSSGR